LSHLWRVDQVNDQVVLEHELVDEDLVDLVD